MKTQSLTQRTADRLYSQITAEGRLGPGDKLPNEVELSRQLGVSRATLREAIRTLTAQGVLEVRRGKGTFVASRAAEDFGVRCLVSMEERMGCGVGACLVCACDMADGSRKHVCKDGPVFEAREVDWDA